MFLLSFNDVSNVLNDCEIVMYADDTVIYASAKDPDELQLKLSKDFNRVWDWLEANELVINLKPGKTECMIFGTHKKTKNKELKIKYRHQTISNTSTYKYLGIQLDKSLHLKDHMNNTYKKCLGRMYLLHRLRPQLTIKAATTIYLTMMIPLYTYCSIVTCHLNKTFKRKIISFEERARNIIFQGNNPAKQIPTIEHLMRKRLCQHVFKCITGDVCENLNNYFDIMTNKTRNKDTLLRLPKIKLESSKKSFRFYGAKCFNELPADVRRAQSMEDFLKHFA